MSDTAAGTGASARAIRHHYDVDNAFYQLWLDAECVYSCGLWEGEEDDLERSQLRKLDYLLDESQLRAGERLLDVGCGWGGLLRRARRERAAASATGLTLSAAQVAYSAERPLDGVSVRLTSWEEHDSEQPYDAIVSVGAFEHFARPEYTSDEKIAAYARFFARCHGWLAPGRRLVLQTITYERATSRDVNPFLRDMVFPESELPHLHEVLAAARGLFELTHMRGDRVHYARTLEHWHRRLRAQRGAAIALVGDERVRDYARYLQLCRLGFLSGSLGLVRLTFQRLGDAPAFQRARS